MFFLNGERAIKLLQEHNPRQLVCQSHFAQREQQRRSLPGSVSESIRGA
jgi:hypothetical protein